MSADDFLCELARRLEEAGIAYMLAGSMASSFHGEPRSTQDIDLVILMKPGQVDALRRVLPDDRFYFDPDTARDALLRHSQFNVIDMETGWKADLIARKPRAFSRVEFERRERVAFGDCELWVASAEDVVVSKLEWASRSGGSERQLRDVRGVVHRHQESLDVAYVERWVEELGLSTLWEAVREG